MVTFSTCDYFSHPRSFEKFVLAFRIIPIGCSKETNTTQAVSEKTIGEVTSYARYARFKWLSFLKSLGLRSRKSK